MEMLQQIIRRKPSIFLLTSFCYLIAVGLLTWRLAPTLDTIWYGIGGMIGIYLLDVAEVFFAVSPSPFRSILFFFLYTIVSFFVISSSDSAFAGGLVLVLYVQMILWHVGEMLVRGPTFPISQRWILVGFSVVFVIQTYFFIRS